MGSIDRRLNRLERVAAEEDAALDAMVRSELNRLGPDATAEAVEQVRAVALAQGRRVLAMSDEELLAEVRAGGAAG